MAVHYPAQSPKKRKNKDKETGGGLFLHSLFISSSHLTVVWEGKCKRNEGKERELYPDTGIQRTENL
jgi:hypothetical protein